jgi:ubiquinone/menaquinone biosynthesis C-methylase UbiE
MGSPFAQERIRAAYDVAARDYQEAFGDDLSRLPLDRAMLDLVGHESRGGRILDLGCGTGVAGSYLTERGCNVVGLDLSFGMLSARPSEHRFAVCQGDMRQLPFGHEAFAAVVCYYVIQSLARHEVREVLNEVARVLEAGGKLLLAAHLGEGEVLFDEFLGHQVARVGGTFFSSEELTSMLSSAGFVVTRSQIRGPLAHEHQGDRLYLIAARSG